MSEPKKRREYTKEFKQDALNLAKEPGYTVPLVAQRLGVAESLLYRWRKEFDKSGSLAFPGNGKEVLTEKDRQIRELQKRLKDSEMECAILKKAMGIFSRVPK